METISNTIPFLKWAGGKRWFCENHINYFLPDSFGTYIEPFLGSGATFFKVNPTRAILNDLNTELIDTYRAIKSNPEKIHSLLKVHQRNHLLDENYYYKVRGLTPRNLYTSAARFIYLNRTCFNGLYRVNLKGEFNVPKGTKNNVLMDDDDFVKIAIRLKNSKLLNKDFEAIIDLAGKNDLLFVDPPYTVRHNKNGFLKYNETIFSWDDQKRLKDALVRARNRGANIICTNADHKSVRNLYRGEFKSKTLARSSVMSGDKNYREKVTERIFYM